MKQSLFFLLVLSCTALLGLLLPLEAVKAADDESSDQLIQEQLDQSGLSGLLSLVPEEGQDFFSDGFHEKTVEQLTPQGVFEKLWQTVKERSAAPLKLLCSVGGILILGAMLTSFSGTNRSFSMVITLAVCGSMVASVTDCILRTAKTVRELSAFVLSFIPVFAGVTAAAGKPASSVACQVIVFSAAQFFSQLMSNLIVPLLGLFLAISITGAATDVISVEGLAKGLKTAAIWILTFCMTIFVGLLTVRGIVAGAADTVTVRAAKFLLSSFVPVVGGALSDAYSSVFGCLGVVKSTIGVFGIVVIAVSFLPVVLELLMLQLALCGSAAIGDIFDRKREVSVLKAVSSVLTVMLGAILCYGLMIVVSIAILLMMGMG